MQQPATQRHTQSPLVKVTMLSSFSGAYLYFGFLLDDLMVKKHSIVLLLSVLERLDSPSI